MTFGGDGLVPATLDVRRVRYRKYAYAILAATVVVIALLPCAQLILALRLLLAIRRLALGDMGKDLPVEVKVIHHNMDGKELEALLYRHSGNLPSRAIVLSPGISELGSHHPQLVALSRFLANCGFLVITPDFEKFQKFQISAEPVEEIVAWYRTVPALEEGRQVRQVGLAGISFSGTLALIAAARPELRDSAAFVLGIGAYYNLLEMMPEWFSPETIRPGFPYHATRFYARWLVMLAASEMLGSSADRQFIDGVLVDLLRQESVPPAPIGLSPAAHRWYRLAVEGNQADEELAGQIENSLRPSLYQKLDPSQAVRELRCPVFLVHGAYDDLIPPDQSRALSRNIVQAKSYLMITPFLTHTHAPRTPISWRQKVTAVSSAFAFLFDFARAAG